MKLPAKPTPVSGLMDKRFTYVHSSQTDIRATFERLRNSNPLPLKSTPKAPK